MTKWRWFVVGLIQWPLKRPREVILFGNVGESEDVDEGQIAQRDKIIASLQEKLRVHEAKEEDEEAD